MNELDLLMAEPVHERHVVIRRRDEGPIDPALVGLAALGPGELLVVATPAAHEVPRLVAALPTLLAGHLDGVESVLVAVGGLAMSSQDIQYLAGRLGTDVVAPDGGVAALPGAALYAGQGIYGTGWYSSIGGFCGVRFPAMEWESWFPDSSLEVDGVVATPAPCGLVVGETTDLTVPADPRFPKLVVDSSVSPEGVAALLGELPDEPIVVVPRSPDVLSPEWLTAVADTLGRDVLFSPGVQVMTGSGTPSTYVPGGDGEALFHPFPLLVRQQAGSDGQEVLQVAAPPEGWHENGPWSYRYSGPGEVVADVVPSGLVVRSAHDGELDPDDPAVTDPFDPSGWTMRLGTPGRVVGLPVLVAAENLLAGLSDQQRDAVQVRMVGDMDDEAAHALDRFAGARSRAAAAARAGTRNGTPARSAAESPAGQAGPEPVAEQSEPAAATNVGGMPPIVTVSGPPVATVSGMPAVDGQDDDGDELAEDEAEAEEYEEQAEEAEPAPPPEYATETPRVDVPRPERVPHVQATPQIDISSQPTDAGALRLPARVSTSAEQARFTAALGEDYPIALATVNAAMATWPSLRLDTSPGAKADFAAVCVFLGSGAGNASAVNSAIRVGRPGIIDGHVSCLMSGLRRLPTHRRAVLRQGKMNASLEHLAKPGTILTEPGFLTASTELDVTLPDADLDVLIWPCSARRTSELVANRPVDEAVFLAGARFKALAVRTAEENEEDDEEREGPPAPKVAVMYRELAPNEKPVSTELDERDLAVLAKLDNVLAQRHSSRLRLVEDPEVVERLTQSMVVWQQQTAAVAS
ncbi:hypothetical protein [Thermocrispum sp.]|jgi:hypothetical protein|uniref:hypothetical protein n=1 Tax=Thermocrispum sp. TaxID=2060768 RepID=UPI00257EB0FB|nr:hypothetical protein [Thermocrispum sp.]